ncbi:solute carrier family 49 member A3-like [Mercenaria mercenaria]|uniref:solute carrier family 49 member A3-like n=1 Tax=Mercenaria mercenaria TaxID=6596 RepID=UPI00234F0197|nr:solute carrier family 49 member A3-like [Mercenaria mercenaria]
MYGKLDEETEDSYNMNGEVNKDSYATNGGLDTGKNNGFRHSELEVAADDKEGNRQCVDKQENVEQYKVYPSRWFMLFVVCCLNLSNAMMWITFAAAADTTITFYRISSLQLNMLSMTFMFATVPLGFVASWVLDTFGLRTSLLISAWLNGLGGLLRNISTLDVIPEDHAYTVLLIGQILAACAQPFVMFAPTKLAALWFPENRRATANMIGSMMNPLGNMVAFIIVPLVVEGVSDIPLALWIVSAPAFFITLVTTFGVRRSRPPTPPSPSAGEITQPFLTGLKQIIVNKNYVVLNLGFGAGLALFTALASFLEQILCPRGYSDEFAGICGALMIVFGMLLSAIAGVYVDKTKQFDDVLKVSYSLAVLSGIAFTQVSRLRDQHVWVAISAALFGGFGLTIYPISMELAVEVTYPVAEATSSGLCIVGGQAQGIAYMFAMQYLTKPLSGHELTLESGCHIAENATTTVFEPQDWTYSNLFIFNVISTVAVVMLVLLFKPKYKRLEAEKKIAALAKKTTDTEKSYSVNTVSNTEL